MYAPREDFGTPVILGTLTRSRDWAEPYAGEGDWQLVCVEAGDDE